ncbi:MAG: AI-2E family transporter [Sporomusaceae bacterium]|nr:AI-2E family transporter [Sporomusaceae bacterium]
MLMKPEKKYLLLIFYICLTVTGIFISYNLVFNIGTILGSILSLMSRIVGVLEPLIIGAVIAYLLFPLTDAMNKLLSKKFNMKRKHYFISVILTYFCVIVLFLLVIVGTYLLIGGRITENNNLSTMVTTIREYIAKYNELFKYVNTKITESGLSGDLKTYLNDTIVYISTSISQSIDSIFAFSRNVGSVMVNMYIGFFLSFYLLKDYDLLKRNYDKAMLLFFEQEKIQSINRTGQEINHVVSRFIRGQVLDAFLVGLISSIGLTLIGMDFAILIGFTAGMANMIPFVGPLVGCIPAIIVGVLSPDPMQAVWAVLVLLAVQQLDEVILSPKIVGDSTGLHPVLVIMAIIIGAAIGGIIGMLLAVPTMGVIQLFAVKYIKKRESERAEAQRTERD